MRGTKNGEVEMIRCVRMWSDADEVSRFEEGRIDLGVGNRGDALTAKLGAVSISYAETSIGSSFEWHTAPARQFVITLAGTLEFQMRNGSTFLIRPGDILLAEDTVGSGHSWRLVDDQPWRRAYVILAPAVEVPFHAGV